MNRNMKCTENIDKPFESYAEYMDYLYACVNSCMYEYINSLKDVFATGQGDYKNVMYPDIEIASDTCERGVLKFSGSSADMSSENSSSELTDLMGGKSENGEGDSTEENDELSELLKNFASSDIADEEEGQGDGSIDDDSEGDGNENGADRSAADERALPADQMMKYVID